MNYKKFIKSRGLRQKILKALCFIPDKTMLKLQYKIKFGRKLNLKAPQRFTEKLQWYKLYYRDPLMIQCVDKYDVREYVKEKGFEQILNDCYGCYDNIKDIDFDSLPNEFVLKNTLGGGGNEVIIVKDKNEIDKSSIEASIKSWLKTSKIIGGGREWPYYKGKKNRVIFEKLLRSDNEHGLVDYKFFCFNGRFEYMYVVCDRVVGESASFSIYNRQLERMNVKRAEKKEVDSAFVFPENINEMIGIAESLSADFPHARIDLYNVSGKIIFGEITLYNASGYMSYDPDSFDYEIGEKFTLPEKRRLNQK